MLFLNYKIYFILYIYTDDVVGMYRGKSDEKNGR